MNKKILAALFSVLLLVAGFAYAANMQINASASPVSGGSISPSGIKFSAVPVTYTATPKAGWALTNVTIDGVVAVAPYTVPFDTSKIHTVKANFAQALYSITTTAGATGGTVLVTGGGSTNIAPGSNRSVVVGPSTGYRIATLSVDGAPVVPADPTVAYTQAYTNIQASKTVAATFSAIPVLTKVDAGIDQNIPAFTTNLSGSVSDATPVVWSCPTAGTTFGTPNALTTTFSGPSSLVPVTYVVTLTAGGVTDTINVTLGASFTQCNNCHSSSKVNVSATDCTKCHNSGAHGTDAATKPSSCIACHSVAIAHPANVVSDNNGVRAITTEFEKWSHHVTGVTLQDAHCAACHLEGKAVGGAIVVDKAFHMADNMTHLRNADTNADIQWDPAAPSFSNMDNFCLSCHDANGATGIAGIQAVMVPAAGKTASAGNPFGDTISNQYDLLERPAVVDAKSQFATGNNSHHAVLGKKYTGRTRIAGSRQIADVAAFTNGSTAALPGARSTIYDAGKFTAAYTTLADAAGETGARNGGTTLGDDSTLHCGDCHTVGQYRAADVDLTGTTNKFNKAVIGAHGSANEYLLRNNVGTDARHQGADVTGPAAVGVGTKPYLVCFNCHAFETYGSIGASTGAAGFNHAGEYANTTRCNGPDNTIFGNMTGEARLRSMNTITTATGATGYGKPTGNLYGNVFGIQCNNCHNSGVTAGNIFGGIHGSADQTYTDGMGNTTKHNRFMPGFANIMYVPGTKGGVAGGSLAPYNSYSGNRNGTGTGNTVGQTYTTRPYRTIVPGVTAANVTLKNNGVVLLNQPSYGASAAPGYTTGSYQFTTGGVSNDLNWEQKSQQPVAGEFDYQAKSMGCYTLTAQTGPAVSAVGAAPQPNGTASQSHAAFNIQAGAAGPDGTNNVFDNWGGCDDHGANQGAGTGTFRKVLRKVSY